MRPMFGSPFKKRALAAQLAAVALMGGALADVTPASADVSVGIEVAPEITVAEPEEVMVTTEPPDLVYEERLDMPGPGYVWVGDLGLDGRGVGWYPGRWLMAPEGRMYIEPYYERVGPNVVFVRGTGAARCAATLLRRRAHPVRRSRASGRLSAGRASPLRAKGWDGDRHAPGRLLRARDRARSASPARRRPVVPSGPARDASGARPRHRSREVDGAPGADRPQRSRAARGPRGTPGAAEEVVAIGP